NEALHRERAQLLIAIDEEGGDVTRLEAATGSGYPGNLALGFAGDVELTRSVAASMGAVLARAGVDLDLAPDADVNSNPANPVIGVRSFGAEPDRVAEQTVAFVSGLLISDGIDMGAITGEIGLVAGAVRAIAAGCDAICVGGGPTGEEIVDELRDAIVAAVESGAMPEQRLREAAGRVDELAAWRA